MCNPDLSVYLKLTSSSTHEARLVDILELTLATVVVNRQLCGQLTRLRQMLEDSKDGTREDDNQAVVLDIPANYYWLCWFLIPESSALQVATFSCSMDTRN